MYDFDFFGFEPSEALSATARKRLNQIATLAVGVVSCDAAVVKTQEHFEGWIKIRTPWRTYSASDRNAVPETLLRRICDKVKTQMNERRPVLPVRNFEDSSNGLHRSH